MDNTVQTLIRSHTAQGIEEAKQAVLAASFVPTPTYDSKYPQSHIDSLIMANKSAAEMLLIKNAYEVAYPQFQAFAIALRASLDSSADFGCAPQTL